MEFLLLMLLCVFLFKWFVVLVIFVFLWRALSGFDRWLSGLSPAEEKEIHDFGRAGLAAVSGVCRTIGKKPRLRNALSGKIEQYTPVGAAIFEAVTEPQ